jgi:hypothetical protein
MPQRPDEKNDLRGTGPCCCPEWRTLGGSIQPRRNP